MLHVINTFEISARGRSCFRWSVNFLDFSRAACSKVFRKASLSLMKERLAKSAVVQYVTVFRLILAKRMKHWSRAGDGKALRALLWAVTRLRLQKVSWSGRIYLARAKLMLLNGSTKSGILVNLLSREVYMWWFAARERELLCKKQHFKTPRDHNLLVCQTIRPKAKCPPTTD